jgi:hypothetical protein
MDPNFEPLRSIGFNDHDPAKVPKFKYRHDGALSIRNFALNQAQLIISHTCQLTDNQKISLLGWFSLIVIWFTGPHFVGKEKNEFYKILQKIDIMGSRHFNEICLFSGRKTKFQNATSHRDSRKP